MGWLGLFTAPAWDIETFLLCSCLLPAPAPAPLKSLICCAVVGNPASCWILTVGTSLPFSFCQNWVRFSAWGSRLVERVSKQELPVWPRRLTGHYFCLLLCPTDFHSLNEQDSESSGSCSQKRPTVVGPYEVGGGGSSQSRARKKEMHCWRVSSPKRAVSSLGVFY